MVLPRQIHLVVLQLGPSFPIRVQKYYTVVKGSSGKHVRKTLILLARVKSIPVRGPQAKYEGYWGKKKNAPMAFRTQQCATKSCTATPSVFAYQ